MKDFRANVFSTLNYFRIILTADEETSKKQDGIYDLKLMVFINSKSYM